MKDKKNMIIIILFLIFIILNIFVYFNKKNNLIFLGNNTKISVKNGNISIKNKINKINLTKAKIYFNGEFIDGYIKSEKTKMNNNVTIYNAYNKDGKNIRFSDDLFAYTGNLDIKIADYNKLDTLTDEDINLISEYLNSENGNGIILEYSITYRNQSKIIYDLDNDGENEIIYSLEILNGGTDNYTYVFMVDDGEFKNIASESGSDLSPDTKKVSFFNIFDFNNDGKSELVIKLKTGEYGNNLYKIYNYNNEFIEIK